MLDDLEIDNLFEITLDNLDQLRENRIIFAIQGSRLKGFIGPSRHVTEQDVYMLRITTDGFGSYGAFPTLTDCVKAGLEYDTDPEEPFRFFQTTTSYI